ncbi:MAG: ATP-binding protein [Candidatus Muiribacteriaceae bacterium]
MQVKRFKAVRTALPGFKDFIDKKISPITPGDPVARDIRLVCVELATNIIKHSTGEFFDIEIISRNDEVIIEFDYKDLDFLMPVGRFREKRLQEDGLGLHIVESLTDEISYEYDEERGLVNVRVSKKLHTE